MSAAATKLDPEQPAAPRTRAPMLFEIVESMRAILRRVDEQDGEITPDIESELAALEPVLERKVEAYKALRMRLEGEASACAAMAAHYNRRKARLMDQRDQLRDRLHEAMSALGLTRVQAATASATIQPSPPKLVVHDAQRAIEAGYAQTVTTVDSQRLKQELTDGAQHDFAELQRGEHLVLR